MRIKSAAFITALNNELADRRRRIARLREERLREVCKVIPEIEEINRRINAAAFDLGKAVIDSPDPRKSQLAQAAVAEMIAERSRLLSEHGFPADYLEPRYICADCRDTGRINGELCRCVTQLAVKTAFEDSGLNPAQSFEHFDLSLQKSPKNLSAMRKLLETATAYAESFPNNDLPDMLYYGPTGVGKTYLLNCIGLRVLERGFSVLKLNAGKLVRLTKDALYSEPEERPDFLMPDLLIIDDLGTEPMIPNITVETLLSVLCERQDSNKATLFATNLEIVSDSTGTIQDFYGERFASRLLSPRRVKLQPVRTENVRISV